MKNKQTPPKETETSQSFDKFQRLAKDLLSVSKKELDEKIAEYERENKHRKRVKK